MKYELNWLAGRYDPSGASVYPLFKANVPGNVQKDWWDANIAEDIMMGDNVEKVEITENWWWRYSSAVDMDFSDDEKVFFVAEGIDYIYDILLDGINVCSHEGMFTKTEIELTGIVKKGSKIDVIIHPHPKTPGPHYEPRGEADQSCKPPMCYGWDWNPRLLISGIWKPAYIETRKSDHIISCEPFYKLSESLDSAEVWFETECGSVVTYTLRDMDGKVICQGTEPRFRIDDINLWWCSGHGTPYLYEWTAETDSD